MKGLLPGLKTMRILPCWGGSGLAKSDTLVICRLDHIGTSIDLIRLAAALGKQKAHAKILLEDIDTLRDTGRYEMRSSH